MAIEPISPKDAVNKKCIPDEVIKSFNELITEKQDLSGKSIIRKEDVIQRIISTGIVSEQNMQEIYDKKWLDIENLYESVGWIVSYSSPDYGESSFEPFFTFEPKERRA